MVKLLHIEASPRKERSSSTLIAREFLEEYSKRHSSDIVVTLDVWKKKLLEFDGDVIDAKYAIMHQEKHTEAQALAWQGVEEVISEFKEADKYVFSLPMWNFGIPYKLKQYLDILVQPGFTFKVTPEGKYEGLVTGKNALVIYSRGGAYGPKSGAENLDFQKKYMETILAFIGFTSIQSLVVEPTLAGEEKKKGALAHVRNQIVGLAEQF